MRHSIVFLPLAVMAALLVGCSRRSESVVAPLELAPKPAGNPRIKLAVLVVFDQMRGDFVDKWRPLFGKGGFARLQTDGAWFSNCHYPYGITTTGPGHASMLTGTCPDKHGIINNIWLEGGANVYCAGSTRYQLVPAPATKPDPNARPREVGSPDRLLAETVADVLRVANPKSRIFGLSLKDRSAILPTGAKPDGAYWFNGRFVTSTYYGEQLHPWVAEFNKSGIPERWFGKDWDRFRADVDYEKWSGPDKVEGEGRGVQVTAIDAPVRGWAQGVTFPHPNTGGRDKPTREYYDTLVNSPFGNELLLEFAKKCVAAEALGADDIPDLLVVSFSSNDVIGHTWGPDSQEVLDVTLRSDALVEELLRFLDEKVGKDRYLFAVTSDHGVCPLPELSRKRGLDAKRADPRALHKAVEAHLSATFGLAGEPAAKGARGTGWIDAFASGVSSESGTAPWLYLNPKMVVASGKSRNEVSRAAADFLAKDPNVARAFTREDLEQTHPESDRIARRIQRSYHPNRSGDVYVVLKEWYLPSSTISTGTTHGAPYDYDTHVPLLVFGPGIPGGERKEATTPQAAAAIFARWLDLRMPNRAEFPVPATLENP